MIVCRVPVVVWHFEASPATKTWQYAHHPKGPWVTSGLAGVTPNKPPVPCEWNNFIVCGVRNKGPLSSSNCNCQVHTAGNFCRCMIFLSFKFLGHTATRAHLSYVDECTVDIDSASQFCFVLKTPDVLFRFASKFKVVLNS